MSIIPERYSRFIAPKARARVASLAGVADDHGMQDWPLEVADAGRVDEFIELYEANVDDDERFALMVLVLHSLDEMPEEVVELWPRVMPQAGRALWPRVEELLVAAGPLHAHSIIYWSCVVEGPDGVWRGEETWNDCHPEMFGITPLARKALSRLREEIGFPQLSLHVDRPD